MSEETDFTGFKKISIIGCGLIGGSIGLALKKSFYAGEIVGVDRKKVIEKAIYSGAIGKKCRNGYSSYPGSGNYKITVQNRTFFDETVFDY